MALRSTAARLFLVPRHGEPDRGVYLFNLAAALVLLGLAVFWGIRSLVYELRW